MAAPRLIMLLAAASNPAGCTAEVGVDWAAVRGGSRMCSEPACCAELIDWVVNDLSNVADEEGAQSWWAVPACMMGTVLPEKAVFHGPARAASADIMPLDVLAVGTVGVHWLPACSKGGVLPAVKDTFVLSTWTAWPGKPQLGCAVRQPRDNGPTVAMLLSANGWVWFAGRDFGGLDVPSIEGVRAAVRTGAEAGDGVATPRALYLLPPEVVATWGAAVAEVRALPEIETRQSGTPGPGTQLLSGAVRGFEWRFAADAAAAAASARPSTSSRTSDVFPPPWAPETKDFATQTKGGIHLEDAVGLAKASGVGNSNGRVDVVRMDTLLATAASWSAPASEHKLSAGDEITVRAADVATVTEVVWPTRSATARSWVKVRRRSRPGWCAVHRLRGAGEDSCPPCRTAVRRRAAITARGGRILLLSFECSG